MHSNYFEFFTKIAKADCMSKYYKNILLFQRVGTRGGIVCRMTMTYLYIMYFCVIVGGKKNFCREMYVNFTFCDTSQEKHFWES